MFRMKFFKKPKETKLFPVSEYTPHQDQLRLAHQIAEIYAGFASSRDIEHKVDDGLSKLFDNNFRAVIKKNGLYSNFVWRKPFLYSSSRFR